jgi:Winged helix DNA-binding domain
MRDDVTQVHLDGTPAWMLKADIRDVQNIAPLRSVRLLPAFDQYVVGASLHAHQLLPGNLRNLVYRPQGWLSPVLLVNGLMNGIWRHEIKGSRVDVLIEPFVKLPAWVRRAAGDEAERLANFLDGSLHLTWKS